MEILFVLIPVSLIIVMIALAAFVWSVHNRQYEDLEKEAYRILFDENPTTMTKKLDRPLSEKEEKS